jgi:hypothetical protein
MVTESRELNEDEKQKELEQEEPRNEREVRMGSGKTITNAYWLVSSKNPFPWEVDLNVGPPHEY